LYFSLYINSVIISRRRMWLDIMEIRESKEAAWKHKRSLEAQNRSPYKALINTEGKFGLYKIGEFLH